MLFSDSTPDNAFLTALDTGTKHLAKHDPILQTVIAEHGPCTIRPHTDYYVSLLSAIIGQQLSVKASDTILRRFLALYENLPPTPEQIMHTDTETLRGIGISYAKITYIKDLAAHCIDGSLDLEHISQLENHAIIQELTAVKGIGVWSAHMFLIFCLGRLDILPVGDLGVRKAMQQLYDFAALPSPSEMEAIAEKYAWQPYASIACWYLWRSLENTPVERVSI